MGHRGTLNGRSSAWDLLRQGAIGTRTRRRLSSRLTPRVRGSERGFAGPASAARSHSPPVPCPPCRTEALHFVMHHLSMLDLCALMCSLWETGADRAAATMLRTGTTRLPRRRPENNKTRLTVLPADSLQSLSYPWLGTHDGCKHSRLRCQQAVSAQSSAKLDARGGPKGEDAGNHLGRAGSRESPQLADEEEMGRDVVDRHRDYECVSVPNPSFPRMRPG